MKEIPDFSGYYADETGTIYTTLKRGCRDRLNLDKRIDPVPIKVRLTNNGYGRVYIRRDSSNKREDVYIHRIIANLFIPNPKNLPEVNHKNSNRSDNRVENLEWTDHKDNLIYAMNNGFMSRNSLGQFVHK